MVIRTYTAGGISFGKAAEMMAVSHQEMHEEMKEVLTEDGPEIHLAPHTADEVPRGAENARANL